MNIPRRRIELPGGWTAEVLIAADTSEDIFDSWRFFLERLIVRDESMRGYSTLKFSPGAEIIRATIEHPEQSCDVVCKRGTSRGWRRWVGRSRQRRNRDRALALLGAGIETAQPLALVECSREAWFVAEYVPDLIDLDRIALSGMWSSDYVGARATKNRLVALLAAMCQRLNSAGLSHHDFKASNIMLAGWRRENVEPRIVLLDLDGLRAGRWWDRRFRPLVRLAASLASYASISRADYARFLKTYLGQSSSTSSDWRDLFRLLAPRVVKYQRRAKLRKAGKLDGFVVDD